MSWTFWSYSFHAVARIFHPIHGGYGIFLPTYTIRRSD
jgi:hypothetical protein